MELRPGQKSIAQAAREAPDSNEEKARRRQGRNEADRALATFPSSPQLVSPRSEKKPRTSAPPVLGEETDEEERAEIEALEAEHELRQAIQDLEAGLQHEEDRSSGSGPPQPASSDKGQPASSSKDTSAVRSTAEARVAGSQHLAPVYKILRVGDRRDRSPHTRKFRIGVDLFRTLADEGPGGDIDIDSVPESVGKILRDLQEDDDVQVIVVSYQGLSDRRQEAAHQFVAQLAQRFRLDLRLVIVDHHSGQPFGRPSLAAFRKDLSEDSVERHSFSTGGKDYVCWREGIAALFDDSHRNTGPASRIGVHCYEIDNRARETNLLGALQHFRQKLSNDPEFFSVSATHKRLRAPPEASEEEKKGHEAERRSCHRCGKRGHLARDCPFNKGRQW